MISSGRGIIQKTAGAAGQCDNGTVRETRFIGEELTHILIVASMGKEERRDRHRSVMWAVPRDCWFRI